MLGTHINFTYDPRPRFSVGYEFSYEFIANHNLRYEFNYVGFAEILGLIIRPSILAKKLMEKNTVDIDPKILNTNKIYNTIKNDIKNAKKNIVNAYMNLQRNYGSIDHEINVTNNEYYLGLVDNIEIISKVNYNLYKKSNIYNILKHNNITLELIKEFNAINNNIDVARNINNKISFNELNNTLFNLNNNIDVNFNEINLYRYNNENIINITQQVNTTSEKILINIDKKFYVGIIDNPAIKKTTIHENYFYELKNIGIDVIENKFIVFENYNIEKHNNLFGIIDEQIVELEKFKYYNIEDSEIHKHINGFYNINESIINKHNNQFYNFQESIVNRYDNKFYNLEESIVNKHKNNFYNGQEYNTNKYENDIIGIVMESNVDKITKDDYIIQQPIKLNTHRNNIYIQDKDHNMDLYSNKFITLDRDQELYKNELTHMTQVNKSNINISSGAHFVLDKMINIEKMGNKEYNISTELIIELMKNISGIDAPNIISVSESLDYILKNPDAIKFNGIELGTVVKDKFFNKVKIVQGKIDDEFNDLVGKYPSNEDNIDIMQIPEVDCNYASIIMKLVDENGIPTVPFLRPMTVPELRVHLPNVHYNKYFDIGLLQDPVNSYVIKDLIMILANIRRFYIPEIESMPADTAMNWVLDKLLNYIKGASSVFTKEKIEEYNRVWRMIRWYGESAVLKNSEYWLIRDYSSTLIPMWINDIIALPYITYYDNWINKNNCIINTKDNAIIEIEYESFVDSNIHMIFKACGDEQYKITLNDQEMIHALNELQDVTIPTQAGINKLRIDSSITRFKITMIKLGGTKFMDMTTEYRPKGINPGIKTIDETLRLLIRYYEIHHTKKTKRSKTML